MTEYKAIECALHSQYELAIMHKETLLLHWKTKGNIQHKEQVKPLDIITRNRAEFLLIEHNDGKQEEIRLDYIISSETV